MLTSDVGRSAEAARLLGSRAVDYIENLFERIGDFLPRSSRARFLPQKLLFLASFLASPFFACRHLNPRFQPARGAILGFHTTFATFSGRVLGVASPGFGGSVGLVASRGRVSAAFLQKGAKNDHSTTFFSVRRELPPPFRY